MNKIQSLHERPNGRLAPLCLIIVLLHGCAKAPASGSPEGASRASDERGESDDEEDDRADSDSDADSGVQQIDAGGAAPSSVTSSDGGPEADGDRARVGGEGAETKGNTQAEAATETQARPAASDVGTQRPPESDVGRAASASSADARDAPVAVDRTFGDGGAVRTIDAARPPAQSALCHLDGNQIGVIGDSFIDLSGDVTRFVQQKAREAGALGRNDTYLDRARTGAAMATEPSIPSQFQQVLADARSRRSNGVKLVLMNGGGNDVLLYNRACLDQREPSAACRNVVQVSVRTLKKLFIDMAGAGVEHVIFFWYPNLPGGGLSGERPEVMNNYAAPLFESACSDNSDVTCHFVDTREPFRGHPEYISALDATHPTAQGSRVIADLLWSVMVEHCLGSR